MLPPHRGLAGSDQAKPTLVDAVRFQGPAVDRRLISESHHKLDISIPSVWGKFSSIRLLTKSERKALKYHLFLLKYPNKGSAGDAAITTRQGPKADWL